MFLADFVQYAQLEHLAEDGDLAGFGAVIHRVSRGPGHIGQGLLSRTRMGQAHRLGRRRREATLVRTGQGLGRRRALRQGREGGGDGRDGVIDGHIADHDDVDGAGSHALDHALLQFVESEGGDDVGRGEDLALVARRQIARAVDGEGAARRGPLLRHILRQDRLDLLERRRAQTGVGQIGGQHLHLQLQVGGTGGARQLIGVAVDGEAGAVDLAGQDPAQC